MTKNYSESWLKTNFLEQSAWGANSSSFKQEIPCIIWNQEVYSSIHQPLNLSLFWARSMKFMPPMPLFENAC